MTAPIILSGILNSGKRFTQFWHPAVKLAGVTSPMCMAEMNWAGTGPLLRIAQECPHEWIADVLEAFPRLLVGEPVTATHTVEWAFGKPTFTAVN